MSKLPPPPTPRRVPFLQREDWLISAGLVLGLYVLTVILIYVYLPDSHLLKWLVHLLVPIAAGMAGKGIRDRGENTVRERAVRAKRRHAELDLKKLEKADARGAAPADEEKKK